MLIGDSEDEEIPLWQGKNEIPAECQSFSELLDELKKCGLSFRAGDEALNSKKILQLGELIPPNLATTPPMKRMKRNELLKEFPAFLAILPKALDKDLTNLSASLSRMQKNNIKFLYRAQLVLAHV